MRVLIDTEVLISAYTGAGMPRKVQALLAEEANEILLSSVSIMEIAMKNGVGKLQMGEAETKQAVRDLRFAMLSFTPQHALRLFDLPPHHRDPFDRMLIATALTEEIPLVGSDRKFKSYKGLHVIW